MAFCVKFTSDGSYSEIPEHWLIDQHHCWWPKKSKNPVSFMTKKIIPKKDDDNWEQYEITIEKRCSSLQNARKRAADINYSSTDNEDISNKGRGKRKKKQHKFLNHNSDTSDDDNDSCDGYTPPPKLPKKSINLHKSKEDESYELHEQNVQCSQSVTQENTEENTIQYTHSSMINEQQEKDDQNPGHMLNELRENPVVIADCDKETGVISLELENTPILFTNVDDDIHVINTPSSSSVGSSFRGRNPATIYDDNDNAMSKKILNVCSYIKLFLHNIDERLKNIEQNRMTTMGINFDEIEKYIPINSKEELDNFEILIEDLDRKNQFHEFIKSISGRDPKDFCQRVLKRVFTNRMATLCSWLGLRNNIKVSNLNLIAALKRVVSSEFRDFKESNFDMVCSEWFRQAKLRYTRELAKQNK